MTEYDDGQDELDESEVDEATRQALDASRTAFVLTHEDGRRAWVVGTVRGYSFTTIETALLGPYATYEAARASRSPGDVSEASEISDHAILARWRRNDGATSP